MATVVYSSAAVVGHQSITTNGAYTSYAMSRASGAFPASGYRITGAVLTCTLRNAQWDTITVKAGSVTLGSFDAAGASGARSCTLTTGYAYADLASVTLYGSGVGTQIASGSYVQISVTWEYTASTLTLSASQTDAGGSVTASIVCKDASFAHQIVLAFGSRASTWNIAAGTSEYAITVPLAWLDQIPNTRSGAATVTLRTLSGGSVIGSASKPLTISAPASAAPTFSASVAPLLTVEGVTYPSMGAGVYVQSNSGYSAAISGAQALYGAAIAGYSIRGGGYAGTAASLDSGVLGVSGQIAIIFAVTDSRGLTTQQTAQISILPYAPPSGVISGWRVDEAGNADVVGVLGKCKAVWTHSALGGANTCTAKACLTLKGASEETELAAAMVSGETYAVAGSAGSVQLALTSVYVLKLALTDAFGTVSVTSEIPSARFAMHFSPDGTSVAFGAACQRTGAVEIADDRTLWTHGKEILDLIYPVGAIYLSVNAASPASIYGGTWEQITDRFLLAAGSAYTAGETGGAASVTLAEEQLPKISGTLLTGYGNNGATAGGFGPLRSGSGCLSVAQERQYTGPTTGTATALSGNYAQVKLDIGGGQSVGIMPPYLAVYVWKRIA